MCVFPECREVLEGSHFFWQKLAFTYHNQEDDEGKQPSE